MEKVTGEILNDEKKCEKVIINAFVEKYYNDISSGKFKPYSKKTEQYKYIDAKTEHELFIITTRIVKQYLKYNKAIAKRLEYIKNKVEGKLNGTFYLFVFIDLIPKAQWKNLYKEKVLNKISDTIMKKHQTIEVGKDLLIDKGITLYKVSNENFSFDILAFGKTRLASDSMAYMTKLFRKLMKKLRTVEVKDGKNLIIILKCKGIIKWWATGRFVEDMIANNQPQVFSEEIIDGVYEIIFDDKWTQDITLNICYPKKMRGSRGLCTKDQLFMNETVYKIFRDIYFPS